MDRIAIVAFRFGSGIVGGAETSLRTLAQALSRGGQHVEVFTTCTDHESAWSNTLPAGTGTLDGLTVHRFAIDAHDSAAHHDSVRRVVEANGRVDDVTEAAYLRHSIHSTALIEALRARQSEFDAIITGPYLFGLTHDVAQAFPEKTLLLPCFHDEPFARLRQLRQTYGLVGGILYHSPEEQDFAQRELGLNHPRAAESGTVIDARQSPRTAVRGLSERYVVYCGRYSEQKNVPLLLEYAERYQREQPERFQFVFVGQGEVRIPGAAWAKDRGRLEEEAKRQVLARAAALVQLSRQESLSLVVLEAWAQGTPAIVHEDCAVLRGQVARAKGGAAVRDYDSFAQALDLLWDQPTDWQQRGANGRRYVLARYGSEEAYRQRLLDAVAALRTPLRDGMRLRGQARAAERGRPRWRLQFAQFIDQVLDAELHNPSWNIELQPQTTMCRAANGSRSALVPVRVVNSGTLPALADGPAQTELVSEVVETVSGKLIGVQQRTELQAPIAPGRTQPAAVAVSLPTEPGNYQVVLRAESMLARNRRSRQCVLPLHFGGGAAAAPAPAAGTFLETIYAAIAEAHRLQRLPEGYLDVSEGRCARWKRWLKRKLLGNFKKAYVDVLSRQQTEVNRNLVLSLQQLAEYCATLEHALHGLQQRLDAVTPLTPAGNDGRLPNEESLQLSLGDFQGSQ